MVIALGLATIRPTGTSLWGARALSASVVAIAAFGVWEHVRENYNAGPLDARYAATWDSLSRGDRWWKAATREVGPAPIVAAGALVQTSLAIAAIPWRHPALGRRSEEA